LNQVTLFGSSCTLSSTFVINLLHHAIAAVPGSICNCLIPRSYPMCYRCWSHVFQREARERNAVLLGLRCRVCHQPAQVGIKAANRVLLAVAVPGHVQAGRTLQCQCFIDNGAQLDRPLDQLKFLCAAFFRLPTAISLPAAVIDWRITCRISSGRLTVRYAARRHSAFTRYIPPRSRVTRIARSSSAGAT
jgi:hypothetical protein